MGESTLKFAICFLTCDRTEYTLRTLETLALHNDLSKHILIHGDDASEDQDGPDAARALGFKTLVQSRRNRRGVSGMTERIIAEARLAGVDAVLNLQNDWEFIRPIPFKDAEEFLTERTTYCMRLYGKMKSTTGQCGIHHGGREPRTVVQWQPHEKVGYEIGDIHWGHPPAITLIEEAVYLTKGAWKESVTRIRSGKITKLTVRPIENVVLHIGKERTAGFKA